MKIKNNDITLECTGRRLGATDGILGIDSDGSIYDGYDDRYELYLDQPFTPAERKEISEHMIKLWQKFGRKK